MNFILFFSTLIFGYMLFKLGSDYEFPHPLLAEEDGMLAFGGDLSPQRLLEAYSNGIFPWFNEDDPIMWWALNPRMVLLPNEFHCSKSLQRCIKSNKYEVRIDTNFEKVIRSCAETKREGQDGTWINNDMIEAYTLMHYLGYAHSFEAYYEGELVGGLYGLSLGRAFFGESMFARMTDASKVCFAALVDYAKEHNFMFIDAQQETQHLQSLGAKTIEMELFLGMLSESNKHETILGKWTMGNNKEKSVVTLLIGGNQGNRKGLLDEACVEIEKRIGRIQQKSSVYESEAWGFEAEQDFLNQAIVVETNLSPIEVLENALFIESILGRVRIGKGYSSRTMDIDIMFIDDICCDMPKLILPHPRIQERNFVLEPLCEIMPNYVHPKLGKTIQNLLTNSPDKGKISKYIE